MTVINIKTRELVLPDLSKPLPLPRVTCKFRHSHLDYYAPVNAPAALLCQWKGYRHYIRREDISKAMHFVTVEIENE